MLVAEELASVARLRHRDRALFRRAADFQRCRCGLKSDLPQRQRLQAAFFPEELEFQDGKFGTAVTNPIFSILEKIEAGESELASPQGFEPWSPP